MPNSWNNTRPHFTEEEVSKSFSKFETLLSSQKARECLRNAESALAFDAEVFLQPIRQQLGECMEIMGDLVRERGAHAEDLDRIMPKLSEWLMPGSKFATETAALERQIAEKKRKHPDFVLAMKLQMLAQKFEENLKELKPDTGPYFDMEDKLEKTLATLNHHRQTKLRIAQRALAPDMLELAVAQLDLAQCQEKVLRLKQELLEAGRNQARQNLSRIADLFREVELELADAILSQTRSLSSVGAMTQAVDRKESPKNLAEYRQAIEKQAERLENFDAHLKTCHDQLQQLIEMEETIFNTFGEKLRERGIQFKKPIKVEKSGTSAASQKQTGLRMVTRRVGR